MKPQVDYNRAFTFLMEDGEDGLNAYMNRLNAEHFDEEGKPKTTDSTVAERLNPDEMTYNEVIAELKRRGVEKYTQQKKKVKRREYNPDTKEYEDKEVEVEEPAPAKFNKEEAIARLKEEIGEAPAPKEKVTEKLKLRDMKQFPDDALYVFLQQKSNSREASDIAIMRGKSLQGRLSLNADGTRKKTAAIAADVQQEIEKKFKNLKCFRS